MSGAQVGDVDEHIRALVDQAPTFSAETLGRLRSIINVVPRAEETRPRERTRARGPGVRAKTAPAPASVLAG